MRIVFATGSSQFEMLKNLTASNKINWGKCEVYHLDEYIGLGPKNPASFVHYLNKRLISKIPPVSSF